MVVAVGRIDSVDCSGSGLVSMLYGSITLKKVTVNCQVRFQVLHLAIDLHSGRL